jgi:hypothetical protein
MPVSSLQPCICALKHPKATLLTLNAGPCRGVLLLPVLPACTGADPGLFCMRQMVMVAGRRRCSMLHAPCSMLHAPRSKLRQSIFLSSLHTDPHTGHRLFSPAPCICTILRFLSATSPAAAALLYSTPYMYSYSTPDRQTALICASLLWLCTL